MSRATEAVAPFDHVTVIEAGAFTSLTPVITKCHSVESHSWSMRAFAWMVVMPPPVVVEVLVLPPVVVDVLVPVVVPPEVLVEVEVVVLPDVPVEVDEEVPAVQLW